MPDSVGPDERSGLRQGAVRATRCRQGKNGKCQDRTGRSAAAIPGRLRKARRAQESGHTPPWCRGALDALRTDQPSTRAGLTPTRTPPESGSPLSDRDPRTPSSDGSGGRGMRLGQETATSWPDPQRSATTPTRYDGRSCSSSPQPRPGRAQRQVSAQRDAYPHESKSDRGPDVIGRDGDVENAAEGRCQRDHCDERSEIPLAAHEPETDQDSENDPDEAYASARDDRQAEGVMADDGRETEERRRPAASRESGLLEKG